MRENQQRLTTLELQGCIKTLQTKLPARIQKVYQPENKGASLILKLQAPGQPKYYLRLIPGFGAFQVSQPAIVPSRSGHPGYLAAFLRPQLKQFRLMNIRSVGWDRIIRFTFQRGDQVLYIDLECYDQGNLIVCNNDDRILFTAREHEEVRKGVQLTPFRKIMDFPSPVPYDQILPYVKSGVSDLYSQSPISFWGKDVILQAWDSFEQMTNSVETNKELDKNERYRMLTPQLSMLDSVNVRGYVDRLESPRECVMYPKEGLQEVPSFHDVIRQFIERQETVRSKSGGKGTKGKKMTDRKLRAEQEIKKRMSNLHKKIAKKEEQSMWLMENAESVDALLSCVDRGTDSLVRAQVEKTISCSAQSHSCKDHTVILKTPVGILNLQTNISAFKNANALYGERRTHQTKLFKTEQAKDTALRNAERKDRCSNSIRAESIHKAMITLPNDQRFAFEDFHWYINSIGQPVLAGKCAKDNESLWKRMEPDDIFVHTDIHGAPATIVRNGRNTSPKLLAEAVQFAVCRSKAWQDRVPDQAWYVEQHQVSKSAPTGEYLSQGGFLIRGKKTICSPPSLEMGACLVAYTTDGTWTYDIDRPDIKTVKMNICPWSSCTMGKYKVKFVPNTGKPKRADFVKKLRTKIMKMIKVTRTKAFVERVFSDGDLGNRFLVPSHL